MADVIFVFPKGIIHRKEYLFKALNVNYEVSTDATDTDKLMLNCTGCWGKSDFEELTRALRLAICQSENLGTDLGKEGTYFFTRKHNQRKKNLHGEVQA